jgi:hypothetical protein
VRANGAPGAGVDAGVGRHHRDRFVRLQDVEEGPELLVAGVRHGGGLERVEQFRVRGAVVGPADAEPGGVADVERVQRAHQVVGELRVDFLRGLVLAVLAGVAFFSGLACFFWSASRRRQELLEEILQRLPPPSPSAHEGVHAAESSGP